MATGSFYQKLFVVDKPKNSFLQHFSHNCGDSKDFVATKVANVAIATIWLDNAVLDGLEKCTFWSSEAFFTWPVGAELVFEYLKGNQ